ncbi:MAG TPA: electron transfer flavoprotein subunit beta/FixA family protein [Desulfomonilia bacterium]
MNILVCIKEVPDTGSQITLDERGKWIDESKASFRMNRYDEHALEEALKIKDILPDTAVHALTFGPARAARTVRRALETGADEGFHVLSPEGFADAPSTSAAISAHAKAHSYDLILCGVMSEDSMQSQVGPMIAAMIDVPFTVQAVSIKIDPEISHATVERELSGSRRQMLRIKLPCLITVQTGINRPRYPSLSNVLRARKQPLNTFKPDLDLKQDDSFTLHYPDVSSKGTFIEGTPEVKAGRLVQILNEHSLVKVRPCLL